MQQKLYYTAADLAAMVGVGRTTGYSIVKQLNTELKEKGYLVIKGKVPKDYFDERYFGGSHREEVNA